MAAAIPAVSAGIPPDSTSSPCALFPTESEAYFCLSCNARCSGLALLVGPHTNHDYLPLFDALLYMPAALLREAREVVQEAEESFIKPWRVQDQQREDTLLHLLSLRRSKLAAVTQLIAEMRQVDHQLLHVTEAKALDIANWRYQQRELRRKMEKLCRGATVLASCFAAASSPSAASGVTNLAAEKSRPAATVCPSSSHTRCVAQKELTKVREVLQKQLTQLEEEERSSAQRLETWHRLLSEVPWGGNASGDFSCTADPTGGVKGYTPHVGPSAAAPSAAAAAGMIHTPAHEPPPQPCSYYSEHVHASEAAAGVPLQREQQQTPSLSPSQGTSSVMVDRHSAHPSDAEVVLLQHALHNINSALRQRLLHAAAASLASSSSSRSPTTSHHTLGREEAAVTSVTISGLPPLPDATPLRSMQEFMQTFSNSGSVVAPHDEQSAEHPSEKRLGSVNVAAAAAHTSQTGREQQRETSPLPRCAEEKVPVAPAESGATLDAAEEAQRHVWWQSLQAREQAVKDSLDQLLQSATTTSSPLSSRERGSVGSADGAGRPAGSAICSSISAYPRSLDSR
ncbi:hypothetical protein, conserved [Leishmania tarentolae]|uniref:Uncharacterized protein n=1 Tax=Leishmania tarentolae TaxID=5689 RepID=A0A640KEK7_LEITA|nr:hypothetical protein, conserved [Leishmania tarentolae]